MKNGILEKYHQLHNLLSMENQEENFCQVVHQSIQRAINALPENCKIAVRPFGEPTEHLLNSYCFGKREIIGIFDKSLRNVGKSTCGIPVYQADEMCSKKPDVIVMTSYRWREGILCDLRESGIPVIDIYELLEQAGIKARVPYDRYVMGCHEILNHYYMNFLESGAGTRAEALKQLCLAAIEAKDFCFCREICCDFCELLPEAPVLLAKLDDLYAEIRKSAAGREGMKDVFLYWIDAVPLSWLRNFPGLCQIANDSYFFKRAYTCTPYSHSTLRAWCSGIVPIDNFEQSQQKISNGNSQLLSYLETAGYEVIDIGHDSADITSIEDKYLIYLDKYISCNTVLWESMLHMVSSKKPVFVIAHFAAETHPPMLSPKLHFFNYMLSESNFEEQMKISSAYIDVRLCLYHELLGDTIQVFLSDHGEHISHSPSENWLENKIHPFCFATGKGIKRESVNELFSYRLFSQFIVWLLASGERSEPEFLSDYAVFQDTDVYSEAMTRAVISQGAAKYAIAYRGAVTYHYKYAVNSIGEEFFYRIQDGVDIPMDRTEASKIKEMTTLKELAGGFFPDVSAHPKYRHVHLLYEAIESEDKNYAGGV